MAEEENNDQIKKIEEQIEKGKDVIEKLSNNETTIYYFTIDTQGTPTGGVANIYEHVKLLNELGYDAKILHQNNEYHGVQGWLGDEYMELPHVAAENQDFNVGPEDIVVVPEAFASLMKQIKDLPCRKVVLCQSYYYALEQLPIGDKWNTLGFTDVITTSQKQADYVKELFPQVKVHIVPVSIPEYFNTTDKIKDPMIAIHTREKHEALKIIKEFYLKYPQYNWISFQDMRGIPRKSFAEILGKSCLSVWVDDISGFGTMPIESIECDTPVIGKIPEMIPEWMLDKNENDEEIIAGNGIWTNNKMAIPDLISKFMKLWFQDDVPQEVLDEMEKTRGKYPVENQREKLKDVYGSFVEDKKNEIQDQIDKITQEQEKVN